MPENRIRLLRHVPDLAPQQVGVEAAHVDAVDQHRALGGIEQPGDEVDERRLAGSGAPDDGRGVSGLDPERDVAQHRLLRTGVSERDVAELERAVLGQRR